MAFINQKTGHLICICGTLWDSYDSPTYTCIPLADLYKQRGSDIINSHRGNAGYRLDESEISEVDALLFSR